MKKSFIAILIALFAFAGTASAKNNFDFKNANNASEKREKMKAAVQATFEKMVAKKFGNEAAHTKSGRVALRVTVLDTRVLRLEPLKRRSASSGTPTPEKPETYIYLCDISPAGAPLACIESDAKFEQKRDAEVVVSRLKDGKPVDEIEADNSVSAQTLRSKNTGSPRKLATSNPAAVSLIRDLSVSLPAEIGEHQVELRTFWFVDPLNPNNAFYFPNVETIVVEPIAVLFWVCRHEGATDADDTAEFQFGFVPWNGKFPASPLLTANKLPMTPAAPSKIGPDPDYAFATLFDIVISAKNYGDVQVSSVGQGIVFKLQGTGSELTFEWFEPFELPLFADLYECESAPGTN